MPKMGQLASPPLHCRIHRITRFPVVGEYIALLGAAGLVLYLRSQRTQWEMVIIRQQSELLNNKWMGFHIRIRNQCAEEEKEELE